MDPPTLRKLVRNQFREESCIAIAITTGNRCRKGIRTKHVPGTCVAKLKAAATGKLSGSRLRQELTTIALSMLCLQRGGQGWSRYVHQEQADRVVREWVQEAEACGGLYALWNSAMAPRSRSTIVPYLVPKVEPYTEPKIEPYTEYESEPYTAPERVRYSAPKIEPYTAPETVQRRVVVRPRRVLDDEPYVQTTISPQTTTSQVTRRLPAQANALAMSLRREESPVRSQPEHVEPVSFWGPPTRPELKTHDEVKPHKAEFEDDKADAESVGSDSEVERDGTPNPNLPDTPATTPATSRNTSAEPLSPLAMLGKGKQGSVHDEPKEKELTRRESIEEEEWADPSGRDIVKELLAVRESAKADEGTVEHGADRKAEAIAQADLISRKTPPLETESIGRKPIMEEESTDSSQRLLANAFLAIREAAKADEGTVEHGANRKAEATAQADPFSRKTPQLETESWYITGQSMFVFNASPKPVQYSPVPSKVSDVPDESQSAPLVQTAVQETPLPAQGQPVLPAQPSAQVTPVPAEGQPIPPSQPSAQVAPPSLLEEKSILKDGAERTGLHKWIGMSFIFLVASLQMN